MEKVHFDAIPRLFTYRQLRQHTEDIYRNLDEAKERVTDKVHQQNVKNNRIKANHFRKVRYIWKLIVFMRVKHKRDYFDVLWRSSMKLSERVFQRASAAAFHQLMTEEGFYGFLTWFSTIFFVFSHSGKIKAKKTSQSELLLMKGFH